MIHGRFQPFHNGHLDYLRKAAARCEVLIVGITNPDPTAVVPEADAPIRHLESANPFTFFQRLFMVRQTVLGEGYDLVRVPIVPFPIHHPERWRHYMPAGTVHYVRVFSTWERAKSERMAQAGLRVEVLDPGAAKAVSGEEVRRRLREGGDWQALVPPAVVQIIDQIRAGTL